MHKLIFIIFNSSNLVIQRQAWQPLKNVRYRWIWADLMMVANRIFRKICKTAKSHVTHHFKVFEASWFFVSMLKIRIRKIQEKGKTRVGQNEFNQNGSITKCGSRLLSVIIEMRGVAFMKSQHKTYTH